MCLLTQSDSIQLDHLIIGHMRNKNNHFVDNDNTASVPEPPAIEQFWSILKELVYAKNWKVETAYQSNCRLLFCLKKVDMGVVQAMNWTQLDEKKLKLDAA
uniref:Uncharacterized protein n=1 Tax=Romanomermis culicivorax TaxID=13658 RepID=A0A915L279_ROMCU